jgi:hypothetical protein
MNGSPGRPRSPHAKRTWLKVRCTSAEKVLVRQVAMMRRTTVDALLREMAVQPLVDAAEMAGLVVRPPDDIP